MSKDLINRIRLLIPYSKHICLLLMSLSLATYKACSAQHDNMSNEYRTSFQLKYKIIDPIKISIEPEVRFDEDFSVDESMISTALEYSPLKLCSLGTEYRFIRNERKKKEAEYLHRFAIYSDFSKKIYRFQPELKIMYTNYSEDEPTNENYLRTKFTIEYNIPKIKINPYIGYESYYLLNEKTFYKNRYMTGLDIRLFKKNRVKLTYKFDDHLKEYKYKNIFELNYMIKL